MKNLLGNPLEITDKLIKKIITGQLDIKLEQFTKEELDAVLKKKKNIQNKKAASLDKIPSEIWKARKFDDPSLTMQCSL